MKKDLSMEFNFLRLLINILSSPELDLEKKMDRSLNLILEKVRARKGSIMILSEDRKKFQIVASTNKEILNREIPLNEKSISGYVVTTGEPVYLKDIKKSERFRNVAIGKNYDTPSLICMPLRVNTKVIGVINISDHIENISFTEDDFLSLKDYASILSPLLENTRLFQKLQEERERYKRISEELKISQEELLATYSERQELVQMVVHDFKSPLSAIISNLDLLKYIGLTDQQKEIVETALNGAKKLLEMINEFLQIARMDEFHEHKKEFREVSLLSVLNEVLEEFKPQAEVKHIEIMVENKDDIYIFGTPSIFHHLLQNLISNAVKYTPENGNIKICWEVFSSKRAGDKFKNIAKVCIEDNGPGVPDELKSQIFNRFRRLKRDKDIQGTGIGLFICKRIVNLLGGKIWVEDVEPTGSRFCFTCYSP